MLNDSLDILNPRGRYTAEGTYWAERPDSTDAGGTRFNYEYVDPFSKTYRVLFGNIQSVEAGETTIRTNDIIGFQPGGFVMTADGRLFNVLQVAKDYSSANKQALRLLGTPLSTEFVLRLVTAPDNVWGAR